MSLIDTQPYNDYTDNKDAFSELEQRLLQLRARTHAHAIPAPKIPTIPQESHTIDISLDNPNLDIVSDHTTATEDIHTSPDSATEWYTSFDPNTTVYQTPETNQKPHTLQTQPNKTKRTTKKTYFIDYSLSFVLLVISVALGFNIAFQYNTDDAQAAAPQVAGVNEVVSLGTNGEEGVDATSDDSSTEDITQEEFEAWMNEHYPTEAEQTQTTETQDAPTDQTQSPDLLSLFGLSSLEDINQKQFDTAALDSEISLAQQKAQYIAQAQRIDSYIATYRSFEAYDNQLATPLSGMTYIAVSEQTGIPLKYLLALSRAESRFGTDRFTASGNLTRPGKHNNPCSIGLDDSGGNIHFATWEEGLKACGSWYQYFENKGVPNCRKWGIFNPNGDYCTKIETLAKEIDTYLTKQ